MTAEENEKEWLTDDEHLERRAHDLISEFFALPSPGVRDRQLLAPLIVRELKSVVADERDGLNQDYEFTFTPREQWIIRLFLKGLKIEEVSAQVGSPVERVQQIKTQMIRKLEHSEKLRAKRNLTSGKEGRF
jgi:hypothetical protein